MAYYPGSPYLMPWWLRDQNQGPTRPGDMPTGQIMRDPSTMGTDALQHELMALQSPYGRYGGRIPAFLGGGVAGLGGIPGLGFLLGGMAQAGMQNRMGALGRENTQRQIMQQYPSAASMPASRPAPVAPPAIAPSPVGFMQSLDRIVESASDDDRGYSSADRSGRNETTSQRGGLGGV